MYCVLGEHHIFLLNNECSLIHGGRQVVCVCSMICICISYVDSQGGSIVYSRMVWGPLFLKGSVIFRCLGGAPVYDKEDCFLFLSFKAWQCHFVLYSCRDSDILIN